MLKFKGLLTESKASISIVFEITRDVMKSHENGACLSRILSNSRAWLVMVASMVCSLSRSVSDENCGAISNIRVLNRKMKSLGYAIAAEKKLQQLGADFL
jgi:hypothetical protein